MDLNGYTVRDLLIEDHIAIQKEYFVAVTCDLAAKMAFAIFGQRLRIVDQVQSFENLRDLRKWSAVLLRQ
jgi:hypothetical protein